MRGAGDGHAAPLRAAGLRRPAVRDAVSGGQQARFQILLLELAGATLLLLDEPTDNLDLVSAEALEAGLAEFRGTVIAVTHDRWFLRGFDRFLVFERRLLGHRPPRSARRLALNPLAVSLSPGTSTSWWW